jgi:hypothetical protein
MDLDVVTNLAEARAESRMNAEGWFRLSEAYPSKWFRQGVMMNNDLYETYFRQELAQIAYPGVAGLVIGGSK